MTQPFPERPAGAQERSALDSFFDALRRLDVRRSDDGWIGGVCAGLATRLGVDPIVVRAALVLLGLFFGLGVSLYLVAWLLIPDPTGLSHLERGVRSGEGASIALLVVTAVVVLGGLPWWGGGFLGDTWFGWSLATVVVTALVLWGLWTLWQRREPAPAPSAGPAAGSTSAWPTAPPRPIRRRAGFTAAFVATGLAFVAFGGLAWAGDRLDWSGNHQVIAMAGALGILGVALLVLGLAGRRSGFPGFLAALALVLTLIGAAVPQGMTWSGQVGQETWRPTTIGDDTPYTIGVGEGRLDLAGLDPASLDGQTVTAGVTVGTLRVVVPDELTVQVLGEVGVGDIHLEDGSDGFAADQQGGVGLTEEEVLGEGPVDLVLDLQVGIGQIHVAKE